MTLSRSRCSYAPGGRAAPGGLFTGIARVSLAPESRWRKTRRLFQQKNRAPAERAADTKPDLDCVIESPSPTPGSGRVRASAGHFAFAFPARSRASVRRASRHPAAVPRIGGGRSPSHEHGHSPAPRATRAVNALESLLTHGDVLCCEARDNAGPL